MAYIGFHLISKEEHQSKQLWRGQEIVKGDRCYTTMIINTLKQYASIVVIYNIDNTTNYKKQTRVVYVTCKSIANAFTIVKFS